MLHIDALIVLGKDELEELIFDGPQLTGRSINDSLPVAGSSLRLAGSAQPGNFLAPLGQKWEGHAENFTGSADGEILLHTEPVALLHKHDLLEEGIPLAVGGPVGLSPLLFFILAGKSKFEERRKRGKNRRTTD